MKVRGPGALPSSEGQCALPRISNSAVASLRSVALELVEEVIGSLGKQPEQGV